MKKLQTLWIGLSLLAVTLTLALIFTGGDLLSGGGQASVVDADGSILEKYGIDLNNMEIVSVSADDDAILGNPDAPVTIIEFSDYQCPYCSNFAATTMLSIKQNYVDQGLVKIIFRDYPLPGHDNAAYAALAAECAGEESDELYYAMHDKIFEEQSTWSPYSYEEAVGAFTGYAEELGVGIAACMTDEAIQDEVNEDFTAGRSYGVSGTPAFFINGKKLVGAYPYEVFEAVIEAELQ